MNVTIEHPKYGKISYDENAWTGRKTIVVGIRPCTKLNRRTFRLEDGTVARIRGNFLSGSTLLIGDEEFPLTPRVKWYEVVLAVLPFIFDVVWGNVVELVAIFPIVGGAIGGLICGAGMFLSLYFMRKVKVWWQKVLIGLLVGAAAILICYAIAVIILAAA